MKQLTASLLALSLLFTLSGCGKKDDTQEDLELTTTQIVEDADPEAPEHEVQTEIESVVVTVPEEAEEAVEPEAEILVEPDEPEQALLEAELATMADAETDTPLAAATGDTQLSQTELLNALSNTQVSRTDTHVTFLLPAEFTANSARTQADYDIIALENHLGLVTLNADGTLTCQMTIQEHTTLMEQVSQAFSAQLSSMMGSTDYPNFVAIDTADDFRTFTITCSTAKLSLAESFSVLTFSTLANLYHTANGTVLGNCHITFLEEGTDTVLLDWNSAEA